MKTILFQSLRSLIDYKLGIYLSKGFILDFGKSKADLKRKKRPI